ncbi:hypothetical protein GCM10023340_04380 [Nocardioides marinquilinus]|uniref:O-antigen ligase-related domain-containing protein n=1 Tax=Nocardioides marinquilinus TaxID=1210400 RepID=A0ABP9PC05_9ACTN
MPTLAAAWPIVGLVLLLAVPLGWLFLSRPQRGLLLLAALAPFDGLLLIVPGGASLGSWKEGLVLLVLAATFVAPPEARRPADDGARLPGWAIAALALTALGAASAVVVGGIVGLWGFKVGFFYLLLPVICWRCPLDAKERDRLVGILMAAGVVTAVVGLAQQVVGPERLNELGYTYNDVIRFSGSLLRSFSTFTQPFSFGLFVMLVLLLATPVAIADHRRLRNRLFLLSTPLLLIGMATSVVRGAILGLVAGMVFLALWRYRGLVHLVPPLLLVPVLLPASVLATFLSSSSLGERGSGWQETFGLVAEAPWGQGLGTSGAAAEKALELGAERNDILIVGGANYQPDNQYVKTLLELGPIGLWLLLLVGAAALVAAVRTASAHVGVDRALAEGVAACLIAAGAGSLVATYLEIFPLDLYFWLLLGVLLCLDPRSTSTPSPSAPEGAGSRPTSASSSPPSVP